MRGCLSRLLAVWIIGLCLALYCLPAAAAERSWVRVQYGADIPPAMTKNLEDCLDTVADLLSQYRIYLSQSLTIVVTADSAGYIQTLMSYGYSRANAEQTDKNTAAVSLNAHPVIIIKGTKALRENRQEIYRVVPHEIFHQVQRQWGKLHTVTWMVEGAPELFRMKASEQAGLAPTKVYLAVEAGRVKHAKALPSAQEIGTTNYLTFSGLAGQGYPVYPMSTLMLAKLVEGVGFDKVVYFYQQLHYGVDPDKAFLSVFRVPMQWFLTDMDRYFGELRKG